MIPEKINPKFVLDRIDDLRKAGVLGYLVAGIVCAMLISGCGAESVEPVTEPSELSGHEHMDYVKFDGHEYVRYTYLVRGSNCAIGGIAHSPKCSCVVNK